MFFDLQWRREKRARKNRGERRSAKRDQHRARRLALESLEDRRVLSVGPLALLHAAFAPVRAPSFFVAPLAATAADTTTTLTVSTSESTYGQPVTFTATVSPADGGTGTFTRRDTVEFLESLPGGDTKVIARARLSSSGVATATVSNLSVDGSPHSITAKFNGDPSWNSSTSAPVTVTVNQADSTTTVFAHPSPSALGQSVTFVATVARATGTTTAALSLGAGNGSSLVGAFGGRCNAPSGGNVNFYIDGSTTPVVVAVNRWGVATYSTNSLELGPHTVYAVYDAVGDPNFKPSPSSDIVTHQVVSALTSTRLTAVPRRFSSDGAVTLTATVRVRGGATFDTSKPLGSVDFLDGSTPLGTVPITAAMLNTAGTVATVTFTPPSNLLAGPHMLAAAYSGSGIDYGASTGYLGYWVGSVPWPRGRAQAFGNSDAHDNIFAGWQRILPGPAMGGWW